MAHPFPSRAVAAALLLAPAVFAQAPRKVQQPELIDRELFFGDPEISQGSLSPDGAWIAFLKPYKGVRNVWVKRAGEPFEKARPLTALPKRPVPGFFWSRDGKQLLFVQDHDGDENYNVYAVDPAAAPEAGKEVPSARNLTAAKGARTMIYSLPKSQPDTAYVGLNDRDAAWHDLYKVSLSTGERTLIRKNTARISAWIFDTKGELRLAMRTTEKGDTEILRMEGEDFKPVYTCGVFESAAPIRFHKDGKRIYLMTNKGQRDRSELVLFDPANGKEELVHSDPLRRVDLSGAFFSDVTDELQVVVYNDEKTRLYFQDKALQADHDFLKARFPGKRINFVSETADERTLLVSANSDTDPGSVFLFERKGRKLTPQYVLREELKREAMSPMQPIRYKSSDGLEIPAYLTLPKGVAAKGLPLIVLPHGGPWARDSWGFNGLHQFLANRGYAVLSPNFRGSTGYGKKFLDAGNGQWGDRMQDDLTWGVKHLVARGLADPQRVGIMGGSYGGYATLAGVTFTPDLYKAGVAIVGPSNLITLLETIPPYWEAGRVIFHKRMGDPTTPEGKKQLERQSPLNSAAKIHTPLMVVQGANDPRVKKAESDQIVVALRDRSYPVSYLCAPDEGHGFQRPVNNMALFMAAEKFLATHLKGRFQEDGTDATKQRLGEITVDPKSVVLAKKVDGAAVSTPKTIATLKPRKATFQGTLAAGGQEMPVTISREIKEEAGGFVITDAATVGAMQMNDATTYDKASLVPRTRTIQQGPVTITLAFEGGKATGSMGMGGNSRAVSAELGGDLYGDGAGSDETLACLPLAEGYTATVRTFDVMKQKVSLKTIKVVGVEDVKVAAGTYKTWKVSYASAEGEPGGATLWIDQQGREVVKQQAVLAHMGGAVLTVERQP